MEIPIVIRATTSVVLRPILSPKWPNSMEPNGRARNETANVRNAYIVPSAGLAFDAAGKKIVPK